MSQKVKVKVDVTLELDKAEYDEFRKTYDETSLNEIASSVMNDAMEQFNAWPEDGSYWLDKQTKRLMEAKRA